LVTGLARKVGDVIKPPVETRIIEDAKPPPQDTPPPPSAYIPSPEVNIQLPLSAPSRSSGAGVSGRAGGSQ